MGNTQPNILLIQLDQLAASKLECYGNEICITPNISRLAEQGLVFERAYSNFPLCAPSRFSMLSGRLASHIGVYDNGSEFAASVPTINHFLRAQGYQTCLVGKMHFVGPDQLHGYETRLTTDIYPADFGWTGDWTEVTQKHSNNMLSFTRAGVCRRNPQMEYDEEVTYHTERKLFDLARCQDTRPFFLTVSMTHPHDPYQCLRQDWDLYRHDDIDMPAVSDLPESSDDPYSQRLRTQYGLNSGEMTNELIRIARHGYYGSVSYADRQIGKMLDVLAQTGLDKNTVIVITSDHGDMLGERGLWYKKSFFEDSVRVPLIISGLGVQSGRAALPVSLIDLAPTLHAIASTGENKERESYSDVLENLEGDNLLDLVGSTDRERLVYSENLAEGAMAPIVMVCGERYKYIRSGVDPEQLFDLHIDPLELSNIASDSTQANVLSKMREHCDRMWDLNELNEQVINSQNQRLFIKSVVGAETSFQWDFNPADQATSHYLRADRTYNEWAYDDVIGLDSNPKK